MFSGVISVYWASLAVAVTLPSERSMTSVGSVTSVRSCVAVHQALDDPGGLEIDEDGQVVRAVGRCQYADHLHLQRIDAGQVEQGLRRGQQGVAGPSPSASAAPAPSTHSPSRARLRPSGDLKPRKSK